MDGLLLIAGDDLDRVVDEEDRLDVVEENVEEDFGVNFDMEVAEDDLRTVDEFTSVIFLPEDGVFDDGNGSEDIFLNVLPSLTKLSFGRMLVFFSVIIIDGDCICSGATLINGFCFGFGAASRGLSGGLGSCDGREDICVFLEGRGGGTEEGTGGRGGGGRLVGTEDVLEARGQFC